MICVVRSGVCSGGTLCRRSRAGKGGWGVSAIATKTAWFYIKDDQGFGPVSQEQFCHLFGKGVLGLDTLVHSDAFEEWTPASSIAGLRALCVARPIPPVEEGERVPSGRPTF